ncbi:hypothetical protein ABIQ69_06705 [Agromyces sp. G08B096]|uniref:Bacitracin resistance protein n=1 Tax=Agromyces sp. G08B096 TaxID=3156399 RepID=A0AAU7WA26_9MICO
MSAAETAGSEPVTSAEAPGRTQPLWLRVTLAVAFGLFFAYDLWEVVESLVQLLSIGVTFTVVGWIVMGAALVAPVACFVGAFLLGRRRSVLVSALCYLGGLAVSAALFTSLSVLLLIAGSFA